MSQQENPEILVMTFEQMAERIPGVDPDFIHAEIGGRGDLTPEKLAIAAAGISNAAKNYPTPKIMLSIGGYDQDPRDLWEIPEVRAYVRGFVLALDGRVFARLEYVTRVMLAACCGVIAPRKERNPENGKVVFDIVGGRPDG